MTWKMATFNVNGIRARLPLVLDWLAAENPDALCLQEIKCRDEDFPLEAVQAAGYRAAIRGQKAYNGVAILTREEPEEVETGFNDGGPEEEARFITAMLGPVRLINTYVPMGRSPEDPAFQAKMEFFDRVRAWLENRCSTAEPVIWTGDLNVAPEAVDVHDPVRLDGQVGFHPAERERLARTVSWGLTDLFRHFDAEPGRYTFWDYRARNGFKRNIGWRLDHIMVTAPLLMAATGCRIDTAPRGLPKPSDHTPVVAEFDPGRLDG